MKTNDKTAARRCLVVAENDTDLFGVLVSSGAPVDRISPASAARLGISGYDSYCVLGSGSAPDARLRARLEEEAAAGKRVFIEFAGSFGGIYSDEPADTTRSRLVFVGPENGPGIPGLETGDLLDDMSNRTMRPWYGAPGTVPLLVYRGNVIAHTHWDAPRDEILSESTPGLWLMGGNVMMCSFRLSDFNRAQFAPRAAWRKVIEYIAGWLTGCSGFSFPEPVVRYGAGNGDDFERSLRDAVDRGVAWLSGFLVDGGSGGILEGLRHEIKPDGGRVIAQTVRTDCCGEAAGAFAFYSRMTGNENALRISEALKDFVFGPMTVRGGDFDGMLRWTSSAWQVCYQDDAARALLPVLYDCLLFGRGERFGDVCRALDFLVRTTARDGCRVPRTDMPRLDAESIKELRDAEHGRASAHYNAYYHAALLLAYLYGGNGTYLDVARKGLETIMSVYPDTVREQSETEEQCRLILPLAALYEATGLEKHKKMLYRVTGDLMRRRHPCGGFYEYDTGYAAACSRNSDGECSLLTHNGDPVADLLYSVNWLPVGFSWAYRATGDERFRELRRGVAEFCVNAQAVCGDPMVNGSWSRAFDMELNEPYGCPHDVGWAARACETGWTAAEILMGLMMPYLTGPDHGVSH
ncbi:MAG: hypothetical protein K6C36_00595 [Clostridia bacterium]|nr:hypothetical protein [Clostridia bacterium]